MKKHRKEELQTPPVRWLLAVLVSITTGGASYVFWSLVWSGTGHILDGALVASFGLLFLLLSMWFWIATFGFVQCLLEVDAPAIPLVMGGLDPRNYKEIPKTAILMPIYNEDPAEVFAGLRAVIESLEELRLTGWFDLFVLSDTNQPDIWIEEEVYWASLRESLAGVMGRVFYRRRQQNTGRKSGNIADFCMRWGRNYTYMVILDADSVMNGVTLVEMIRRMEQDKQIGILQVPPVPVNRESLFARSQEFAASLYGKIFVTGFSLWTRNEGNYWGHNAIIRVAPFMEHCGLPTLSGRPPLGGEILSHDFVEAALMRRAGYKVLVAYDLGGSYEECPATLIDFAKRDQRWSQGNLQHLRLLFVQGFHPVSRLHFWTGAMSYLSSPLWLLFMVLGVAWAHTGAMRIGTVEIAQASSLFLFTLVLLFGPKLYGYLLLLANRDRLRAHGGVFRAFVSVVLESLISALIAPILMTFNVSFVLTTLFGRTVQWSAQRRGGTGTPLREAVRTHGAQTVVGLAAMYAVAWLAPGLTWWILPIVIGPIYSIPLSMMLSSRAAGRWFHSAGLLLVPEETRIPDVLQRKQQVTLIIREEAQIARAGRFAQAVLDPIVNELHISILKSSEDDQCVPAKIDYLKRLVELALDKGPHWLDRDDRLALLSDPVVLRRLHRESWSRWPREVVGKISRAASSGLDADRPPNL